MAIDYSQYQSRVKPISQKEFEMKQSLRKDVSPQQQTKKLFVDERKQPLLKGEYKLEAARTEPELAKSMAEKQPIFKTQLGLAKGIKSTFGDYATRQAIREAQVGKTRTAPVTRLKAFGARGLRSVGAAFKYGLVEPAKETLEVQKQYGALSPGVGTAIVGSQAGIGLAKSRGKIASSLTMAEAESPGTTAGIALASVAPEAGQFAISKFLGVRRAGQAARAEQALRGKPVTRQTVKDLSTEFLVETQPVEAVEFVGARGVKGGTVVEESAATFRLGKKRQQLVSQLNAPERLAIAGEQRSVETRTFTRGLEDLPEGQVGDLRSPTPRQTLRVEQKRKVAKPITSEELTSMLEQGRVETLSGEGAIIRKRLERPATQLELRTRPERFEEFKGQVVELQKGPEEFVQRRGPGTKAKDVYIEELTPTIGRQERAALTAEDIEFVDTYPISTDQYVGVGKRIEIFTGIKPEVRFESIIRKRPSVEKVVASRAVVGAAPKKSNIKTFQDIVETQAPQGSEVGGGTDQVVLQKMETPKVETVTATKTEQATKDKLKQEQALASQQKEQVLAEQASAKLKEEVKLQERVSERSTSKVNDLDRVGIVPRSLAGTTIASATALRDLSKTSPLTDTTTKQRQEQRLRDEQLIKDLTKTSPALTTAQQTTSAQDLARDTTQRQDTLRREVVEQLTEEAFPKKAEEDEYKPEEEEEDESKKKRKQLYEFTIENYITDPAKRFAKNLKKFFGGGL